MKPAFKRIISLFNTSFVVPFLFWGVEGQTLTSYREFTAADCCAGTVAVDATGVYTFGGSPATPPRARARKFDLEGNELWRQELNIPVAGAATGPTGLYVISIPFSTFTFGQSSSLLRKYDSEGRELWTRQLELLTISIATDASGIYVAGFLPSATSNGQISVRKFDRDGNPLWTRGFDAGAHISGPLTARLAVAPGSVYLLGGFEGRTSIPVSKYDTGGRELWSTELPFTFAGNQLAADATGFYITRQDREGFRVLSYNIFLTKYGVDGVKLWEHQLDSKSWLSVTGLFADGTGVYAAGSTSTAPYFSWGGGGGGLTGQCRSGTYGDAFVRRYDTSGAEVWTRAFGPADGSSAVGAAMDTSGIYVAGNFLARLERALEVIPLSKPYISPGCIVNAASHVGGAVAPGEIVTISGSMIGPPELVSFDSLHPPLAKTLADTRILFNGVPAPLLYVSATRSSAIVPYGMRGQSTVDVQVEYQGSLSDAVRMPVLSSRPGIYTVGGSEFGLGSILNEDGTINSPANPARRGSVITIYGTGGGEGDPAIADGEVLQNILPKISLPVTVTFDDGDEDGGYPGGNAAILYAGGAPGLVAGVFQINLRIPGAATSGGFFVSVGSQHVLGLALALR